MSRTLFSMLALSAGLLVPGWLHAMDCRNADAQYNQAVKATSNQEELLEQILAHCPTHLFAMNNLAVLKEQRGEYDGAEALYRRIIAQKQDFTAAHAGIGDVMAAQHKYWEAANAYQLFLSLLASEKSKGQKSLLMAHEAEYRQKLVEVQKKIIRTSIVAAADIVKALVVQRGFGRVSKPPQIDVQIHFDPGSDRVRGESMAQLEQLAQAFNTTKLQRASFTIAGPPDDSDRSLSHRRAEQMKKLLVERFGLYPQRLQAVAREDDPSTPAPDGSVQHLVTIINNGAGSGS